MPNPVLDHVFTFLFLALVAFVLYTISLEDAGNEELLPPWLQFVLLLFIVAAVVAIVKRLSTTLAHGVNTALVRAGLVDKAPIVGKVQMKKWQDQFWQFVVHVSMTIFEVHVLSTELSGLWGDMSNAWRPDPWEWHVGPVTRRLYLVQLVRGDSGEPSTMSLRHLLFAVCCCSRCADCHSVDLCTFSCPIFSCVWSHCSQPAERMLGRATLPSRAVARLA